MTPSTAYALFKMGKDTYEIAAMREGRTEAEVVDALMEYRRLNRGNVSDLKAVGQGQAEDVRL